MKKDIVDEFIEATPMWIEALKNVEKSTGKSCCFVCGADYKNIEKLLEAVKKLKEKAWMYDDLCK